MTRTVEHPSETAASKHEEARSRESDTSKPPAARERASGPAHADELKSRATSGDTRSLPAPAGKDAPNYGGRTNPIGSGVNPERVLGSSEHPTPRNLAATFSDRAVPRVFGPGEQLHRFSDASGSPAREFWVTSTTMETLRSDAQRNGESLKEMVREKLAILPEWQRDLSHQHTLTVPADTWLVGWVGNAAGQSSAERSAHDANAGSSISFSGGAEQVAILDRDALEKLHERAAIRTIPFDDSKVHR